MSVTAVARSPLANTTNRPWQQNAKPTQARSTYATGNGVSAVRSRVGTNVTPAATIGRRAEMDAVTRSGGAVARNSPGGAGAAPPSSPGTGNPRATVGAGGPRRELFPTSTTTLSSNTTPAVARSTTWRAAPARDFGRFGMGTTGSHTTLPTTTVTNKSLDSATFGNLLHTRDSKFLIPPFRPPQRPTAETPDVMSLAANTVASSEQDSVIVGTPTHSSGTSSSSPTARDRSSSMPPQRAPMPPPEPCYYTIVFDLDETLCCNRGPGRAVLRPGCLDILKSLRALSTPQRPIEIILWTASVESLARTVLTRLDPDGSIFTDLIFRDKRWFKETGYTKDLRLLGRDMERVVIIENSPMSVTLNRQQAILVKDFLGHAPHDTDLKAVKEVLESWVTADRFVPIREWLAQHPRVDRNNHVIAAPALSGIVGGRGTTGAGATTSTANSPARRGFGATRSPLYSRGW